MATVTVGTSEDVVDVNFGWDYQFLPEPLVPYSYMCTANMNAFIRRGPGTDFLGTATLLEGETFEVFAKSEFEKPLWLFGKSEKGDHGWVSEAVLECTEIDPKKLDIRWTPLHIPTPTPTPPPVTCSPKMDEYNCLKTGGTWFRSYCKCP